MAILRQLGSNRDTLLGSRHLVGRSAVCQLRIEHSSVSGVHAELTWNGAVWEVHDLGSRNGTFVDGRRLEAGERASLAEGVTLGFGVADPRYRLFDASGPILAASSRHDEIVLGEAGILHLPSVEDCELSVFYSPAQAAWVVETPTQTRPIEDQEIVAVRDQPWRVTLPAAAALTREATALAPAAPALSELSLQFFVSRDGEHVSLELIDGQETRALEARSHLQLLLELARTRLADSEQPHLGASEHGWVHREDLLKMLGIDLQLLNLWVHRARRQLASEGVVGAGGLIERRSQAQQLRIGVERLVINRG
ncbi:MAG: FHA domain-containing protein [Enhygromyxa sp.]